MNVADPSTMDNVTWAYRSLRDAWHVLNTDTTCAEAAPWNQWVSAAAADDPISDREILLQVAQLAAADAGRSVLHHLRLLARAYPPDAFTDDRLDPNDWPGFATFTLARTALEGAAVIAWSLQEDADERCLRSARLQLWSACEHRRTGLSAPSGQPGSVEYVRAIVEAAGFEVRECGRDTEFGKDLAVAIGGQPRPFYAAEAVRDLLGAQGVTYYRGWSGTAHHAPWAVVPWTSIRLAHNEAGLNLSTYVFEDKHVELAADVAVVVRAAGISVGTFYGRNTTTFHQVCTDVEAHLRDQTPVIRQALGRPGGDPLARNSPHRCDWSTPIFACP